MITVLNLAELLFCSLALLFFHILVAVEAGVILTSSMIKLWNEIKLTTSLLNWQSGKTVCKICKRGEVPWNNSLKTID